MFKRLILMIMIFIILFDIAYAVCETDYEDEDYLDCLKRYDGKVKECEEDKDCAGICSEINDENYSSCLVIEPCIPPQKCGTEQEEVKAISAGEPDGKIENYCNTGLRESINNTLSYCINGRWVQQKEDNLTCNNNFECLSNFCSDGYCYDISAQIEENKSILQSILEWLKGLFRI